LDNKLFVTNIVRVFYLLSHSQANLLTGEDEMTTLEWRRK